MNTTPSPSNRSRCKPLHLLIFTLLLAGFGTASTANATVVSPYIWTGLDNSDYLYSDGNWLDERTPYVPESDESEDIFGLHLIFGNVRRTYITYSELYASQIEFQRNTQGYYLSGDDETTHIGSGGIIYNPAGDIRSTIDNSIQLHASQIWNIQAGTLSIQAPISDGYYTEGIHINGNYQIEKTGDGDLEIDNHYGSSWSGGLKLTAGTVSARVGSDYDDNENAYYADLTNALGNGPLIFNGGTLRTEQSYDGEYGEADYLEMYNNIISNGLVSIQTRQELRIENFEGENFFRLDADTLLRTRGAPIFIEKDVIDDDGDFKLTIESDNAVILLGSSGWTGGTHITKGALIFGGEDNTPGTTGGIQIDSAGYAGIGVGNNVSAFLSEIDKTNSNGTIGFDSDLEVGVSTFSSDIDLTGFNSTISLGSATAAILSGTITPQGTDYRFGGGGGVLYVASLLTDPISAPINLPNVAASSVASNVIIDSSGGGAPLTVQLMNPSNSFSGTLTVNDSAVIFGDGVSLPGTTGNFSMNAGGYIGNANDPDGNLNEIGIETFLGHFATTTPGIIGFDLTTESTSTRNVYLTGIDLSGFSGGVYLGTASALRDEGGDISGAGVRFTGTINADSNGIHRFAAYKGGALDVTGTLTGTSMIIGSPDSQGSFGDEQHQERSAVLISGNNTGTLANGVTLYGGNLIVGQAPSDGTIGSTATNALGAGTISVMPVNFTFDEDRDAPEPQLSVLSDDIIINNAIVLNTDLLLGDSQNFTLGGVISGEGEIYIGDRDANDVINITLSGNNTHTGGIYISNNNTATFTHDNAAGMGSLGFGGSSGATANFETANPVIHGLESNGGYATINLNFDGARTLTIDQSEESRFRGYIYGSGTSTIIKEGAGLLRFESGTIYSSGISDGSQDISLEIKDGTFLFGNNSNLTGGTIKVNGGTLAMEGGVSINRPVTVTSGRIAGFGSYGSSVSIGDGAVLSPGLEGHGLTGALQFSHLELNSGGVYEFHVGDPDPGNINGRDHINVTDPKTLVINATAIDPFIIKIISLSGSGEEGQLSGIDTNHGLYSWTLISYESLSIPALDNIFDPNLFSLDFSEFSSDALYGGDFNLFQDGNQLMLGFTPVPEPSTYTMMLLGFGVVLWTLRRNRRNN